MINSAAQVRDNSTMSSRSQQIMMRSTVKRGDTLNVRARNGVMMISSNVRRSAMRSVTASSSRCGMYTSPTACKQTHVITRSLSSSEPNKAQRKKQSKSRGGALCMNALQGGGGSGGDDRPKLTRESEPKTYGQII